MTEHPDVSQERTHRVAVGACIFFQDRLLLLLRNNPPFTLTPPGGRLENSEDPISGVRREVREETGLQIDILGVVHTWFGFIADDTEPLLVVNYLATSKTDNVVLSSEHSEYRWITREDLVSGDVVTIDENGSGYRPEDLLEAFRRIEQLIS